jgi:hypothetical protein
MTTDKLLLPYCDVSGACFIIRKKRAMNHGKPYARPLLNNFFRKLLNARATDSIIARAVFFSNNPDVSRSCAVLIACQHPCCVRAAHIVAGCSNPT